MKVVIDGNIGAGKSTQLSLLSKVGYKVRKEPIADWCLDSFYRDPPRWALLLQMQILQSFPEHRDVIYERHMISSNHVFWSALKNKKLVQDDEDLVYQRAYDKYVWYPDVFIYLSSKPEECWKRVQQRHQTGDSGVTLEYIKEIDELYKKLVMRIPCKVYVLSADRDAEVINKEIISVLKVENELYVRNRSREKMQKTGSNGRQVLCTPFPDMCSVS